MTRNVLTAIMTCIVFVFASDVQASSRGKRNTSPNGEFSFQLESGGRVLPVYNYNGKSYVEGVFGTTYGIRVMNHTGRRIEAVVTVDGRDVVSGKTGNYRKERGYVIEPYNSVLIEGFRRSWNNVAAFTFTDVGDSYAARMGDASNVGVIGVAVFKEKSRRHTPVPIAPYRDEGYRNKAAPNLGSGYGGRKEKRSGSASRAPASEAESSVLDGDDYVQGLGTAYGDETYSPSTRTTFVRSSRRPSAIMAIRYDDRDGLYQLGVLPRYRHRRYEAPEPFPQSPEPVTFAPPPPRRWWD
jgi:hypothetical protein